MSTPTFDTFKSSLGEATKAKKLPGLGAVVLNRSGNVLFESVQGLTNVADSESAPFTADTPLIFSSSTKIATVVAALQLVEQGKIGLDDPVENYVDTIRNVKLLESWNDDGSPNLRDPKTKATIRQLFTHTAGFVYEFFSEDACKWRLHEKDVPPNAYNFGLPQSYYDVITVSDPGTKWNYGVGIDWLGFVVEAVSGLRLNKYYEKYLTNPLGMRNSPTWLEPDTPQMPWHIRMPDGNLVARPDLRAPEDPPVFGGGGVLHSTLNDFSALLVTLLNGGTHPKTGVQILKPETTQLLFSDALSADVDRTNIGVFDNAPSAVPPFGVPHTLLARQKKGWSFGWMMNLEDVPNGRKKGSGAWCGLGNVMYWVDPTVEGGRVGLLVTGLLPFMDPEVLKLYGELEAAVYGGKAAVVE